jgi:hypothetical protein
MNTVVSPNYLIAAFLAAKTKILSALRDEGGLFEIRFLQRLVVREQRDVAIAAVDAIALLQDEIQLEQTMAEITSPSGPEGAAISFAEKQLLNNAVTRLHQHAQHHATQLSQLT